MLLMAREASRHARFRRGSGTFGRRSSNGSMMILKPWVYAAMRWQNSTMTEIGSYESTSTTSRV